MRIGFAQATPPNLQYGRGVRATDHVAQLREIWTGGIAEAADRISARFATTPPAIPGDWFLVAEEAAVPLTTALKNRGLETTTRGVSGNILAAVYARIPEGSKVVKAVFG